MFPARYGCSVQRFALAHIQESIKGREVGKGSRNGNVTDSIWGLQGQGRWQITPPCMEKWLSFLPDCRLVDNEDIRPILGRKACIGMGILVYQDNDHLNKPEMGNAPVYAVQTQATVLSKEELVTKFKGVQGGSWKLGWCIQNQAGSHSAASPTCSEAGCSGIAAETQRNVG